MASLNALDNPAFSDLVNVAIVLDDDTESPSNQILNRKLHYYLTIYRSEKQASYGFFDSIH